MPCHVVQDLDKILTNVPQDLDEREHYSIQNYHIVTQRSTGLTICFHDKFILNSWPCHISKIYGTLFGWESLT